MKPLIRSAIAISALLTTLPNSSNAQYWRVSATSNYYIGNGSYYILDSTKYMYKPNAGRGSSFDSKQVFYDSAAEYTTNYTYNGVNNTKRMSKRYDAHNRQAVSNIYTKLRSASPFSITSVDSAYYNANGLLMADAHYEEAYGLLPQIRSEYSYNAQGVLTEKLDMYPKAKYVGSNDPIQFKPAYNHVYRYDGSGRLMTDSIMVVNAAQNSWTPYAVVANTYNAAGRLVKTERMDSLRSTPAVTSLSFYNYNGAGQLTYDSTITYDPGASYSSKNKATARDYTYNGKGLVATMYKRDYLVSMLSPRLIEKYDYTYTWFDYVEEMMVSELLMNGTIKKQNLHRYYFEDYGFPTSVATAERQDELIAYPVPTGDFLNIKLQLSKPTRINARILNMQGQTVAQWSDNADDVYYKSIKVDGLMTGNYYLVLDVDGVKMTKAITIAK